MKLKAREGDLIENKGEVIFDVKGLVHPQNRVIAFPRYIPHLSGLRKRSKSSYSKIYALSERFRFLQQNLPHYLVRNSVFDETLCEVPISDIKKHFNPIDKLKELRISKTSDRLETATLQMLELLKENANISWDAIGISGSILVGLQNLNSDIDPVVYGSRNCRSTYSALRSLLKDERSPFKPYNSEELKTLFDFRSKDTVTGFEDFVRTESRKALQGKFVGTDYFFRFVKDWNEIEERYGDVQYRNVGYGKIKATVVADSEAIFTPCTYKVEDVESVEGSAFESIKDIASFRGRFCEQARAGEKVIAQGKVEQVTDQRHSEQYCRMLLGNKPEDYMNLV